MLRTLLTFTLLSGIIFASTNYTVRLAVFKNTKKLDKVLESYPPALRDTIKTYKRGNLTYAYTIPTSDRTTLKTLLPAYQKVFSDAYIQPTRLK
jgi:hypothetical protein